ncbi:hypothetical protein A2U01_0007289, partial [Trifolium medium]|nr:hypothetical protein [Trifolium medium]
MAMRELNFEEPDIEFSLSEHKLKLHNTLLKPTRFSPSENSPLEALLKLQWEYNSKKSLSMEGSHITVDVLESFLNFLYEDTIDDQEYEEQALGLLELGRCYLMPTLTSTVEL